MTAEADIRENYQRVLERIETVACQAGRDPQEVRLVVVTKGHPVETVRAAAGAGARHLGENYADEAAPKIEALAAIPGLVWHMIGHIQSRKTRQVCKYFSWVHSLDSVKLARRLNLGMLEERLPALSPILPVLMECNVSGEETKYGFPAWKEADWPGLLAEFAEIASLPNVEIRGLMTMAPFLPDPEDARPYFQRLRRLQAFLAREIPAAKWGELSMGMSADYEVAIQEGATCVRIGTAILGPRPVKQ